MQEHHERFRGHIESTGFIHKGYLYILLYRVTQGAVGDLRRQMAGISNIRHLLHGSQQCDRTIKLFGQQTSQEMTCFMELK